ncbi:MAG: pyridoxal phosphate-dependent aminotransferase [Eubacterium sp.]|nr:pyridoxal phosphate-dependent aminotransferase [Eubacterium sp.]
MISNKMKSHVGAEGVIRRMFEAGIQMKAEFGAENVYDFSLGNPNVPAPDKIQESIKKIVDTLPPGKIHSYMPNAGFPEVRVEVAKHLNKIYGTLYSEKNIIMTAGAGSALNLLMKSMLDIDDEVVVPCPYFAEYKGYIENYYGKIVEAAPRADGSFLPDMDSVAAAVTPRTKAVIVNTPNNPTGVIYPESVIKELADVLRKKEEEVGHPIYLISDEPYRDIVFDESKYVSGSGADNEEIRHLPWMPDYYDDAIVAYSYSKSLSLPGERIGNIIIPDTCDGADELIGAVTTANLVTGVVNAPSLMQLVIARCLDEKSDVEFYRKNGEILYDIVTAAGFEAVKPQGAFYLWVKAPGGDDNKLVELAKKHHILMVPGSAFAGPGNVRLSYCVARDMIERSRQAFLDLGDEY